MNAKFLLVALAFLVILVVAIPNLLWLLGWLVGKCFGWRLSYRIFGYVALVLVVIVVSVLAFGYFVGRFQLQINQVEYRHSAVPAHFDGYKIVHISDWHLSTFDDKPAEFQRFIDAINAQNPDLVCFTGDLVTIGTSEAQNYANVLRTLHATDGVVSVFGNHDMLIYNRQFTASERAGEVDKLANFECDSLGWHLLRNEHVVFTRNGETLTLVGVDSISCGNQGFRTSRNGDLQTALSGTEGFRILLTHDPTHWRAEVVGKADIPLTLSGHTHSAQIRLFGWSPASWVFDDVAGRFDAGNQTLYINVGLGCTLPMRLNCPAEITVITLKVS